MLQASGAGRTDPSALHTKGTVMNQTISISLTAAVLFGGSALAQTATQTFAQTAPKETAGPLQDAAETSLQLSDTEGMLQAVLVRENHTAGLGTGGFSTAGLSTATLQKSGTWFSSVHLGSSLSEVSDYYQNTLTQLGFEGTTESVSETLMVWTFEKGGRQLSAVFNRGGNGVVANISWL